MIITDALFDLISSQSKISIYNSNIPAMPALTIDHNGALPGVVCIAQPT